MALLSRMTNQELAQTILTKVLEDLKDRSGFRHLINKIEYGNKETWIEIQQTLINKIENILTYNRY